MLTTTIFSFAAKFDGAFFLSVRVVIVLVGKVVPSSTKAYLPVLWNTAVIWYVKALTSVTPITLNSCVSTVSFSNIQTELELGIWGNVPLILITFVSIEPTLFELTVPSGKITDKIGLLESSKSVFVESSTVMLVVVAVFTLPPFRTPDLTGSATFITAPHLTIDPASRVVVNETTSPSFAWVYKNHLPSLCAIPLEVVANARIFFTTIPNLDCKDVSSTVS